MRPTFLISPDSLDGFLLVCLILLGARLLPAAEPSPDAPVAAAEQLKQLNDRTIIGSRISLDTEWDQFKHGAQKARWTLGALWGWPVHDWQDWAVRLELPFVYCRNDESSGHTDIGGVGDIEVATGTALRLNNSWRTAGGVELHADTASNSTLGDSVWRLKPFWVIAHDITDWFTLAFDGEYSHSIAEEHDVTPQGYLELSLPATFILPIVRSVRSTQRKSILRIATGGFTH